MNAERRPTSARCFVYGDQRSVEHSLDALERYRDPHRPTRRVRAVHLSGDALAVLATASGMRDLERLHERPFAFAVQIEPALAASPSRDLLRQAIGADVVAPSALQGAVAARAVLVVCGADALSDADAGALVDAIERHGAGLDVALLVASMALPDALRGLLARPGREVVFTTLRNPLLEPAVEAFLDRRDPERVVLAGRGDLIQAALGAVDFFVERRRDEGALDADRIAELGRRHVGLLQGHSFDTTLALDPTSPTLDGDHLMNAALDAIGLERSPCPVTPAATGVLVVPIVG